MKQIREILADLPDGTPPKRLTHSSRAKLAFSGDAKAMASWLESQDARVAESLTVTRAENGSTYMSTTEALPLTAEQMRKSQSASRYLYTFARSKEQFESYEMIWYWQANR